MFLLSFLFQPEARSMYVCPYSVKHFLRFSVISGEWQLECSVLFSISANYNYVFRKYWRGDILQSEFFFDIPFLREGGGGEVSNQSAGSSRTFVSCDWEVFGNLWGYASLQSWGVLGIIYRINFSGFVHGTNKLFKIQISYLSALDTLKFISKASQNLSAFYTMTNALR